jgi:hypothetical protein
VPNLDLVRPINAAYPPERIAHVAGLGLKLRLVVDVLKLASSTVAEILTERRVAAKPRIRSITALAKFFLRSVMRTRNRSPGAAYATKIANPAWRATASPPYASRSVVTFMMSPTLSKV